MLERDLQIYLVDLLRLNFPAWVVAHVPNQVNRRGKGGKIEAGVKRREGMLRGYPDLVIHRPGGETLLVEMKSPSGSVPAHQRAVHAQLRDLGFDVRVVKTLEQADALVEELGGRYIPSRLGNAAYRIR